MLKEMNMNEIKEVNGGGTVGEYTGAVIGGAIAGSGGGPAGSVIGAIGGAVGVGLKDYVDNPVVIGGTPDPNDYNDLSSPW